MSVRYSVSEMDGYHVRGQVVRMLAPQMIGTPAVAGVRCKCGWGRRFVWEAGRELCDRCSRPPTGCTCAPLWALQMGIVR